MIILYLFLAYLAFVASWLAISARLIDTVGWWSPVVMWLPTIPLIVALGYVTEFAAWGWDRLEIYSYVIEARHEAKMHPISANPISRDLNKDFYPVPGMPKEEDDV